MSTISRNCANCGAPLSPTQVSSCSPACSSALAGRAPKTVELRPCGTSAAIRRHYRRGEPLDQTCRQAQARIAADRAARRAS
jgi:hypothetical protein